MNAAAPPTSTTLKFQPYLRSWKHPRSWLGLSRLDHALLVQHAKRHPKITELKIHTDVPTGTLPPELDPTNHDAAYARLLDTWRKRIDVLLLNPFAPPEKNGYIIEVKPSASYVALGQALLYRRCFHQEHPDMKHITVVILTDAPDPDIVPICQENSIQLWTDPNVTYTPLPRAT